MALARDLQPGDVVDLDRDDLDVGEPNKQIVSFENVIVNQINGGWADDTAPQGYVTLYSSESLAAPVFLPADMDFAVVEHLEGYEREDLH